MGIQLAQADHPDGLKKDLAFVPNSDLFEAGSRTANLTWKSAIFPIPPIFDDAQRVQLWARYGQTHEFVALDEIKITTRERCSPR